MFSYLTFPVLIAGIRIAANALPNPIPLGVPGVGVPGVGVGTATQAGAGAAAGTQVNIPPVVVPASPTVSSRRAPSLSMPQAPALSTPSISTPGVPPAPPASLPSIPAVSPSVPGPSLVNVAAPSVPAIAVAPLPPLGLASPSVPPLPAASPPGPSVNAPFLSDTLGSASFLQIIVPSGAALPISNAAVLAQIPPVTAPLANVADQTSMLPAAITTPSVADALQDIGEELVSSMASALVQLIGLLASNTGVPSVPTNVGLPADQPLGTQIVGGGGVQTGTGGGVGAVIQPPQTAVGATNILSAGSIPTAPMSQTSSGSSTSSLPTALTFDDKVRREAEAEPLPLGGLGGGVLSNPVIPPAAALPAALPAVPLAAPLAAPPAAPPAVPPAASQAVPLPALPAAPSAPVAVPNANIPGVPALGAGAGGSPQVIPPAAIPPVALPAALSAVPSAPVAAPNANVPGNPVPGAAAGLPQLIPQPIANGINGGSLPGAPGTAAQGVIASIPVPSNMPAIIQGVKDAAVGNIATSVTSVPLIGQANQILAILQLLGVMNLGQFGSLATLTNLPQVQSAVLLLNEPDLITTVDVLESKNLVYSTAADGLLSNAVSFIQTVEALLPLVSNIKPVVAYLILEGLGLTGLQDVMDGTLAQNMP